MEKRNAKIDDQDQVEKGYNLIKDLMSKHPEIESTLWSGAVWSILVDGYVASGISYDQFTDEWDNVKHHYKDYFSK
jgi:hypothetical protein